jgi:hypothetical protein
MHNGVILCWYSRSSPVVILIFSLQSLRLCVHRANVFYFFHLMFNIVADEIKNEKRFNKLCQHVEGTCIKEERTQETSRQDALPCPTPNKGVHVHSKSVTR